MTTTLELPLRIRTAVCPLAALARADGVMKVPDKCLGDHGGRFPTFGGSLADCALHISESNDLWNAESFASEGAIEDLEYWLKEAKSEKAELEDQISELEGKIEDLENERCDHE